MYQGDDLSFSKTVRSPAVGWRLLAAVAISVFTLSLMWVLVGSSPHSAGLSPAAYEALQSSGVSNPVTAVLLNYRSYDTLLEIAVILVVAISVARTEFPKTTLSKPGGQLLVADSIIQIFALWLVPTAIVIGGYLLWTGAAAPGGAFQAGAVWAGAGIVFSLAYAKYFQFHTRLSRLMLVVGLLVFSVIGGLMPLLGLAYLEFPPAYAGAVILGIEVAATVSIASVLLLIYSSIDALHTKPPFETESVSSSPSKGAR